MKRKGLQSYFTVCVFMLLTFFAPLGEVAVGDSGVRPEFQLKMAFVYKFLHFVQWNNSGPEQRTICTFDDQPLKGILDDLIRVQEPGGEKTRAIVVKRGADVLSCQIIYFGSTQSHISEEVIAVLGTSPVLTIGEIPAFARSGGIIELVIDQGHIRFIINQRAAKERGLQISSQLLALAKEVIAER